MIENSKFEMKVLPDICKHFRWSSACQNVLAFLLLIIWLGSRRLCWREHIPRPSMSLAEHSIASLPLADIKWLLRIHFESADQFYICFFSDNYRKITVMVFIFRRWIAHNVFTWPRNRFEALFCCGKFARFWWFAKF